MDDWDLQAIVKGSSRSWQTSTATTTKLMEADHSFLCSFLREDIDFCSCTSHEFEGFGSWIYPFIPHPHNPQLLTQFNKQPQNFIQKNQIGVSKHKQIISKKSRQKRVVKEVKAESVCSDSWGWRKYGQKPIKGSPYPRSYYRCSSSKGCSARKQVERSLTDPTIFVITYTAEHNHAEPTRRNALAGTTRKKSPRLENPSSDTVLSPNDSNSVASIEELEQPRLEGVAEGEVLVNMPFEFYSEDLFSGLEDLLFG